MGSKLGWPMRKIIHVDMDAFYASVEQRDEPSLRGKPVVVAWKAKRSVVCAASYEARRFGIRSAMPAVQAEQLCPHAIFIPPDFSRYRTASRIVREIFERHSDRIEPLSLDEAYLEVTDDLRGHESATAVAQTIRREIRQELDLAASAGVAANKFLAKLASDWNKPDGLFVIRPERAIELITPLPVSRIPGVGKVTRQRLTSLGIQTIGQLREFPAKTLEQHLGSFAQRLQELSQGVDERPVNCERKRLSVSSEDTFESDLRLTELEPSIRRLSRKTWEAAARQPHPGHTVVLKLKTSDFQTLTRSRTLAESPADEEELARLALGLRARVGLPEETRYRLVGVGLSGFEQDSDSDPQTALFDA